MGPVPPAAARRARRLHGVTLAGAACVQRASFPRSVSGSGKPTKVSGLELASGSPLSRRVVPEARLRHDAAMTERVSRVERQAMRRRDGDLCAQEAVGLPPAFAGVDPPYGSAPRALARGERRRLSARSPTPASRGKRAGTARTESMVVRCGAVSEAMLATGAACWRHVEGMLDIGAVAGCGCPSP
jgi:hypothetical protein